MVLLIGNYVLDRQQSMQRFGQMMLEGLTAAGVPVEMIQPAPVFGNFRLAGNFVAKWLGYVDKFVLFPRQMRARLRKSPALVHICDHSNAMYARHVDGIPTVVTCHDLLAVRGGLGEATDTPASRAGKFLQRWILSGLRETTAVACDSEATLADAEALVRRGQNAPALRVITLGLSYPYRKLSRTEVLARLQAVPQLHPESPYLLHVGSNLRRKNREGILRIFQRCRENGWPGQLVFAGDLLNSELQARARSLGINDHIVQVSTPPNELLEALYNGATAFVYPSRFEGFGWPIAEAQACGCPVVCSAHPPMNEVAGDGAQLRAIEDEEGLAQDLVRLLKPDEFQHWSERASQNAERFQAARMIADYLALYRSVAPAC